MAYDARTSFKSSITAELDITEGARITLRAHKEGTVATTAGESAEDVRNFSGIPRLFDTHEDNSNLRCINVEVKKERGQVLYDWTARYEWKTTEITDTGIDNGDVPLHWSLRRGTRKIQVRTDRDINGRAVLTETKESPRDGLPDEICEIAYIFSANGRVWNAAFLATYEDAVNSDVFMGTPIGQCKIDDIQADVTFHTDKPPEMNIQVTILVGRPPPLTNLFERNSGTGAWQAVTQAAPYYTWQKRWLAEGFKKLVSGSPVDANVAGESQIPRMHFPIGGALITNVNDACWYTTQTKPMLPFNTFFGNV